MKRINIFLIKSFLGPFIVTLCVTIFILLMQFLWKYIDDLVGKGLDFSQISELLFYASARFVPLALPIAMLLSSVMLFGKLGEQYELIALRSAGISFFRLLIPLIFLSLIICYASFLFSNYVMPIANLKNASMIYDIQKKKPALNIKEGIFYKDIEGYSIKINKKDANGFTLHDIIIYDHTAREGNNMVIIAESGEMKLTTNERFLELTLYNGHSYIDIPEKKRKKNNPFRTTHFQEDLIRFNLENFNIIKNSENLYKGHYAMLNNNQLDMAIDSLEKEYIEKKNQFRKSIYNKYEKEITLNKIDRSDVAYINKQKKQQYNIAINKIRTLESITKSNKNNLEYKKIIITKHKIEWHRKISLAFACLLLFLIGAPLGSIIKQGGFGYPVLIAVLFFLFYYTLNIIGEKSAKELNMLAYEGMWLANIIFIPIAIFLNYKAKSNSNILNTNIISMIFYRIIKKKK